MIRVCRAGRTSVVVHAGVNPGRMSVKSELLYIIFLNVVMSCECGQ